MAKLAAYDRLLRHSAAIAAAAAVVLGGVGAASGVVGSASACSGGSGYAASVLGTDGLVAYWRLGESAGSVACDSNGANDGEYRLGTTLAQPGALAGDSDMAVAFDGATGWVRVNHASSLNVGDRFSVEAWVKRGLLGTTANQVVASKQSGAWVLMFDSANRLVLRKAGGSNVATSTAKVADTTQWHHLVATKDGAAVRLYLDGTEVTGAVADQVMSDNTLPLAIGQSSASAYFNGLVDEVALYAVPLSAEQVFTHYLDGAGAPANTTPPTISGTTQVGQTLIADAGSWTGTPPLAYAYQWRRCDAGGEGCADITGATASTYTLAAADVGATIRVTVTASNAVGASSATSAATAPVEYAPVDGTSQVADPLTGSSDPTYYPNNRRVAVTGAGRVLVVYGRHATGVQLAWRDPGSSWQRATRGDVGDGLLLRDTTGDWPASIAIARDASGAEHAWVIWSAPGFSKPRPLQMRRLSGLDDPAGPTVGPARTIDDSPLGVAKADIAFELAPDGSFRGCVVRSRRVGDSEWEIVVSWFTDLANDTPAFHDSTVLFTTTSSGHVATFAPSTAGMRVVARATSSRLHLRGHDSGTPLTSWWVGGRGVSTTPSQSVPSAVTLTVGDVLAAVETDKTNHVVTVERFLRDGGKSSVDLQLNGYEMPTITTDGSKAWLIMVRSSDGYIVSRTFSPMTGWSSDDRIEIGPEGGGGHAWPNAARETSDRLRFVVGARSSGDQSAVLAYQRAVAD